MSQPLGESILKRIEGAPVPNYDEIEAIGVVLSILYLFNDDARIRIANYVSSVLMEEAE